MMPIALEENRRVEIREEGHDGSLWTERIKQWNIKCSYHISAAVVTGSNFRTSGAVGIDKVNNMNLMKRKINKLKKTRKCSHECYI